MQNDLLQVTISVFVNITHGFMLTDIILQKKTCLSGISEITWLINPSKFISWNHMKDIL